MSKLLRFQLLLLCLFVSILAFSQSKNERIERVWHGFGFRYEQAGQVLSMDSLQTLLKGNPSSVKFYNQSINATNLSAFMMIGEASCLFVPLARALAKEPIYWSMVVVGCGLIMVQIPIAHSASRNMKKAVDNYNVTRSLNNTNPNTVDLTLGLTPNGMGLTLKF